MRDPETIACDVLACALAHDPDVRLIGNVTAAEVAALAARHVMTCPHCVAEAWVADAMVSAMKREFQSASDKARVSNDPTREGYAMAMRDALKVVQAVAERETREVSHG